MNFRSVIKWLRSLRTSAYLMGSLLVIFFAGQIVPQKRLLSPPDLAGWRMEHPALHRLLDAMGMFEIYTSPLAFIALSLFFINLLFVFQSRLSSVWKKCRLDVPGRTVSDSSYTIDFPGLDIETVFDKLRGALKGQKFIREGTRFLSVRNRFGPLGSVLFHVSFLLLLSGGLMLYYTRSTGTAFVAEGQYFGGTAGEFQTLRPSLIGDAPGMQFRVLDITPQYAAGSPVDLSIDIDVPGPNGAIAHERLKVNHPLVRGDTSMLIRRIDIAPVIRLEDVTRGHIYEYAAVILHVLEDRADGYQVPSTSYRIGFEFYPDYAVENGLEISRSVMLNNPVFHVSIRDDVRELFNDVIRPGESREFDGMRFGIEEILFWGEFLLVRERGGMLLWAGFILGITGLCWRFFFFRTEVRGECSRDSVVFSFHCEQAWAFKKNWSEEYLKRIKNALRERED